MTDLEITRRNRVKRAPDRGIYEREVIYKIVDEALYCHVGFVQDGQPYVIPSIHAREGDILLLHGATSSRLIRHVQGGHPVCVTITFLDGLVLARSIYSHSMNYRSAVLFGSGWLVEGEEETLRTLELLSEHIMPGRWADVRKPNEKELKATAVVAIAIESASAKVRTGPPNDEDEDYNLPIWAGILPLQQSILEPERDPNSTQDIAVPDYISTYHRNA